MTISVTIKRRPDYRGKIQIKEGSEYKDFGEIALWEQEPNGRNNPVLKGAIKVDGRRYHVSLWERRE